MLLLDVQQLFIYLEKTISQLLVYSPVPAPAKTLRLNPGLPPGEQECKTYWNTAASQGLQDYEREVRRVGYCTKKLP